MRVLGPYVRPDGRKIVVIHYSSGKKTTKAYARYLMEQYLGRELSSDETVDHIDRDKQNDSLSNLQILSKSNHSKKDCIKAKNVELPCLWCGIGVEIRPAELNRNKTKHGKVGPFCSKRCSGSYGAAIQNGRVTKEDGYEVKPEYYR